MIDAVDLHPNGIISHVFWKFKGRVKPIYPMVMHRIILIRKHERTAYRLHTVKDIDLIAVSDNEDDACDQLPALFAEDLVPAQR